MTRDSWLLALCLSACSTPGEGPVRVAGSGVTVRPQAEETRVDRARVSVPDPEKKTGPDSEPRPRSTVEPRAATDAERITYGWLAENARVRPLGETIPPPSGFTRVTVEAGSFAAFLRGLPLRGDDADVKAFDGRVLREAGDRRVAAVAEIDVSPIDVQQCADSVIRMHAEWMWSSGKKDRIGYHFLSGDHARWLDYSAGDRPKVNGAKVSWSRSAAASDGRKAFRGYLDMVFNYASTISLAQRTKKIARDELAPGDFFILPGGPGHAILILDVAIDPSGNSVALLGQGFMPAQDFHVLASGEAGVSPWFSLEGDDVPTPFWPEPFPWTSLRRLDPR